MPAISAALAVATTPLLSHGPLCYVGWGLLALVVVVLLGVIAGDVRVSWQVVEVGEDTE